MLIFFLRLATIEESYAKKVKLFAAAKGNSTTAASSAKEEL